MFTYVCMCACVSVCFTWLACLRTAYMILQQSLSGSISQCWVMRLVVLLQYQVMCLLAHGYDAVYEGEPFVNSHDFFS